MLRDREKAIEITVANLIISLLKRKRKKNLLILIEFYYLYLFPNRWRCFCDGRWWCVVEWYNPVLRKYIKTTIFMLALSLPIPILFFFFSLVFFSLFCSVPIVFFSYSGYQFIQLLAEFFFWFVYSSSLNFLLLLLQMNFIESYIKWKFRFNLHINNFSNSNEFTSSYHPLVYVLLFFF